MTQYNDEYHSFGLSAVPLGHHTLTNCIHNQLESRLEKFHKIFCEQTPTKCNVRVNKDGGEQAETNSFSSYCAFVHQKQKTRKKKMEEIMVTA